jgi:hypothetical protein
MVNTVQVDLCEGVKVVFDRKEDFGSVVFAKSDDVSLSFKDYVDEGE